MTILALDLGTNTGWAMRTDEGSIVSGVECFKPDRYSGGGMRFLRFKRWLTEMKQSGVSEIYFEEVRRHLGVSAAHVYGGFMGILTAWCEHHEIPYAGVPVATIKKSACGRGNADKPAMVAEAKRLGYDVSDDNEADAIHLLLYATKNA